MDIVVVALSVILFLALLILLVFKIWESISKWVKIWKKSNCKEKWIVSIKLIVKIIIIICLIVYLLIIAFNMKIIKSNQLIQFLFVTEKNKFNWIGITSVLAIISLTFTAWDSRRKLKADLISKSRIKWMDNLKGHIGLYCSAQQAKLVTLELIFRYLKDERNENGELNEFGVEQVNINTAKLDKIEYDVSNSIALIKLNLFRYQSTDDEIEREILNSVEAIDKKISNYQDLLTDEKYEKGYEHGMDSEMKDIDKLLHLSANYFKIEWEKAKRGE